VAAAAGVSQPTVSRALRDDPRVAASTRERIRLVAEELGYVPSDRGRSLSTRRTGRIGVVVEDLGNPFYLELLDALHKRLDRSEARMTLLAPGLRDPERLEYLADGSIDGVVLTTTMLDSPLPGQLTRHGFPFVLLNRVVDDVAADSCCVDNFAGAAEVARAMVDCGHRRIGAIFGPRLTSTGRDREHGFRTALEACGAPLDDTLVRQGRFSFADGQRHLADLLDAKRRPTAVFCANDVIALGAYDAALRGGVAVPGQLSLVGFDDIQMSGWAAFELTTARQDLRRMVDIAVDLLLERLTAPQIAPRQVVLPAELVRRSTLGPVARA
jgi:LacI family transcriptional regulator, galactose operon repressor